MRILLGFILGCVTAVAVQAVAEDVHVRPNGDSSVIITTPDGREHMRYLPQMEPNAQPSHPYKSPC